VSGVRYANDRRASGKELEVFALEVAEKEVQKLEVGK
jgi:hypothetical protein